MTDRNKSRTLRVEGRRNLTVWLRQQIRRFFTIRHRYEDVLDRQRARALLNMSLAIGVLGALAALGVTLAFPATINTNIVLLDVGLVVLFLILQSWISGGRLRRASFVFLLAMLIVPAIQVMPYGTSNGGSVGLLFALAIVIAALLLPPVWIFITALASTATFVIVSYVEYTRALITPPPEGMATLINDLTVGAVVAFVGYILLALLLSTLTRSLAGWADSAQRRARQLEAAAVITETSATAPTLTALLNVVVERIREAYGFYHAQVFLLDSEGRLARLEASTGRAGVALLARGHALRVGSQSVIGQCSFLGEPIVVNDTQLSNVWRANELLPDTRAELSLPLLVGKVVIGVLDVQSTAPQVFQPEDIRSLQIMAQELATTIEKTRLLDALQIRASENQRLFEDAQASLRQIEDLNRRLTREGWAGYLSGRHAGDSFGFTLAQETVERDVNWTAPMRQAYQGERSVVVRQDQNAHIAAVPIRVRGEVIGVLEVERGGNRPWTDEELDMAETLVERLALAVENARLYEQATQATQREQVINKITQDVQSAETIDDILQSALTELGAVLGASRGIVQISPKPEQPRRHSTGPLPELSDR